MKRCAFDAGQTTVAALEAMRQGAAGEACGGSSLWRPTGWWRGCGEVKDADEIARMRRAAALGCRLFEGVLEYHRGRSDGAEVAAQLEFKARMAGAEAMSFETIVASGERVGAAAWAGDAAKLPRRGFVTLDFGVVLDGYCSDMTRTVHLGQGAARGVGRVSFGAGSSKGGGGRSCAGRDAAARWMRLRVRCCGRRGWTRFSALHRARRWAGDS